jgi:hypothetical protein
MRRMVARFSDSRETVRLPWQILADVLGPSRRDPRGMSLIIAADYWRDRAQHAESWHRRLDEHLTAARCRSGRAAAESAAIAPAAEALLAALGERPERGCRPGQVIGVSWAEIDLAKAEWSCAAYAARV